MKVHLYATLRRVVGARTIDIRLAPGATVRQAIEEILARYPDLRSQLLDEEGNLYRHVHVFVNGRDAPYLEEGLDTKLSPDGTLDLFPAVAGGAAPFGRLGAAA